MAKIVSTNASGNFVLVEPLKSSKDVTTTIIYRRMKVVGFQPFHRRLLQNIFDTIEDAVDLKLLQREVLHSLENGTFKPGSNKCQVFITKASTIK